MSCTAKLLVPGVLVAVAALVALLVLVPSGDEKVVQAICTDWDPEDPDALSDVMDRYDFDSLPDEIIDKARTECPERWEAYDAWAAGIGQRYDEEFGVDPTPSAAPSSNSPELTYQDELEFAAVDHTCDELRSWYDANPGDSNYDIALQFFDKCDEVPPPVLSGEIGPDELG